MMTTQRKPRRTVRVINGWMALDQDITYQASDGSHGWNITVFRFPIKDLKHSERRVRVTIEEIE